MYMMVVDMMCFREAMLEIKQTAANCWITVAWVSTRGCMFLVSFLIKLDFGNCYTQRVKLEC